VIAMATRKWSTTAAAELVVLVERVRDMTDAVGGGNIGGRVYRGRTGERAEMPGGAAQVLEGAGFVRRVAEQRSRATAPSTEPATLQNAPTAEQAS